MIFFLFFFYFLASRIIIQSGKSVGFTLWSSSAIKIADQTEPSERWKNSSTDHSDDRKIRLVKLLFYRPSYDPLISHFFFFCFFFFPSFFIRDDYRMRYGSRLSVKIPRVIRDLCDIFWLLPRPPLDSPLILPPFLPVARKILLYVDQPRDDYLWGEGWIGWRTIRFEYE